jgi:hypothetical protein
MASPALRQAVFSLYLASPALAGLGFNEGNIYPNFTPDGPAGDRFMVLRWGTTTVGVGRANRIRLSCWVYNRQPDYRPIANALLEIRERLLTLIAVRLSPTEAILGVTYEGDSDDLYDDGYRAYTRWTSHTITASGS